MKSKFNLRQIALLTGISIVIMTIVAGFIMGTVFSALFELSNEEFAQQISSFRSKYLTGIFGWLIILITDLIVSWGLYKFYAEAHKRKAVVIGSLRLLYSLILFGGIVQLGRSYGATLGENPDMDKAHELLQSFQSVWEFGLIIFGFHLIYLSRLVCEKRSIKQVIAAFLFLAGIGYVGSNAADLFIANYQQYRAQVEVYFILPMILGEFGLAIWLIIKGGKKKSAIQLQCASGSC